MSYEIEVCDGEMGLHLRREANNTIRDHLAYFEKSTRAAVLDGDKDNCPTATNVLKTVKKAGSASARKCPTR